MKRDDFELQWQHRQQALKNAEAHAPADEWMLDMAGLSKDLASGNEMRWMQHRFRWVPYAAAAGLLVAVSVIGLQQQRNVAKLPVAEEVSVEGQTIRFLCNSGCLADEVVRSAHSLMIQ